MKRTKTYPNQRLQLNDYEAVSKMILDELIRSNRVMIMPAGRGSAVGSIQARIFGGFDLVDIAGGGATLQQGKGILPYWHQGELQFGALLGDEAPASYALDFSTMPDGFSAVYVRLVETDTNSENRIFWNPTGTPAEYVDSVATRITPSWEYTILSVTAAAPGHGEWVPIWLVETLSGVIQTGTLKKMHPLYFEGQAWDDLYENEWGDGANDRDADRRLYGITDFHMFVQLVRRQLADIIGDKHYTVPPIDLSKLVVEHSQIDGHHADVEAVSLKVWQNSQFWGSVGSEYAVSIRPENLGEDKHALGIIAKGGGLAGIRNLLTIDRQGVISPPNLMIERFMYANGDAESIPIPGQRWGKYYTPGASMTAYIHMADGISTPLWENNMPARKCRVTINSGFAATVFGGIRTGGFNNGQAEGGFWRVAGQPWMMVSFVFSDITAAGGCDIGFANDRGTLDGYPSRVWVRFDKATESAYLYAWGKSGLPVMGTNNLMSPIGTIQADKLYTIKLTIISPNEVRAVMDHYMENDTVVLPSGQELEESYGGGSGIVGYSAFAVARTTNGLVAGQSMDIYRFDVGDLSYLGLEAAL